MSKQRLYTTAELLVNCTDDIEALRSGYLRLLAQVLQAKHGFDIYNASPSMDEAVSNSLKLLGLPENYTVEQRKTEGIYQ